MRADDTNDKLSKKISNPLSTSQPPQHLNPQMHETEALKKDASVRATRLTIIGYACR
jgi:hypothetical protein